MCNISRRTSLALMASGVTASALGFAPPARADAAPIDLPAPGPRDTCPVCGMFVARSPDWIATVVFADGAAAHFDGPKDFFRFLGDVAKYAPGKSRDQIIAMGVTEYYGVSRIKAEGALFVVGSDVLGPMGHEFMPLASAADAADFIKDHLGKRLLRFAEGPTDLRRRKFGFVFQRFNLIRELTVLDNVILPAAPLAEGRAVVVARAMAR